MVDIYVIPDTQSKEGVKNPLRAIAHHICDVRPDIVIHLGDAWDFPSLSQYDKGKKSHRVYTYLKDVRAGNTAMSEFWDIIDANWPAPMPRPRFILLEGNHENRVKRAIEYGPDELEGLIQEFPMDTKGWAVIPFLQEITLHQVTFCHYFQQANSSGAISSARAILNKRHASCVAGHLQGFDYAESLAANKGNIQAIIAGSCYYHDESYKNHNNHHFRGSVVLRNIKDGYFDFERHSLAELDKKYDL